MAHTMSRVVEILSDSSSSCEDDQSSHSSLEVNDSTLRDLSVPEAQNRKSSAGSNSTIESLAIGIENIQLDFENCESKQVDSGSNRSDNTTYHCRRRLTRPAIAANTFEVLETVPEDEPQRASKATVAKAKASNEIQHHFELPAAGEELSNHPLVLLARKGVPSAEAQLAKHLDGWYQGIISTKIRVEAVDSEPSANFKFEDVHFGISLLPNQNCAEHKDPNETTTPLSFDILVTPLPQGVDLKIDDNQILGKGRIAIAENDNFKPMKESEASQTDAAQQPKLASPAEDKKKHMEVTTSRPTAKPMARIEDSVDALDKLEEQLEAFDEAAHFRQILSPGAPDSETKAAMQSLSVPSTEAARSKTPQPRRTTPVNAGSAFIRTPSTNEPRRSLRKSASMIFLDKPKLKSEEKPAAHALPKRSSTVKGIASLLPPKQTPKSAKRPTIPTFELPGDEVARKLKEKREARLSTQVAAEQVAKPTVSSLRRAKSARAPTRPNFELPGEAISRRKREEREVQLKAQEEEERKRREFKAKPIRSGAGPSTFPRETVTSRARQNKGQLPENSRQHGTPGSNNASPLTMNSASRSPLSKTNNQTQPRGRGLHPEPFGMQPSRSISSSSTVGSGSGIRSSVSTEEVQQQRIRGQDIYKRDNSWAAEREREKREREALAKLAREEAAERSRQQGREWAAKQARKRMTIASIRDVMA